MRLRSLTVAMVLSSGAARAACVHDAYGGRYASTEFLSEGFIRVEQTAAGWIARPFNHGRLPLVASGADRFWLSGRKDREVHFTRDASGCVSGFEVGPRLFPRVPDGEELPLEQVLRGDVSGGAQGLLAQVGGDVQKLRPLLETIAQAPATAAIGTKLLAELVRTHPDHLDLAVQFAEAEVAVGERPRAVAVLRQVVRKDPKHPRAIALLERLGARSPASRAGWTMPFTTSAVFALPTPAEVEAVRQTMRRTKLEAEAVKTELEEPLTLGSVAGTMRLVSHLVRGSRHLGVIWIPDGAAPHSLALLAEAKGVNPEYFALEFPDGLELPPMLGDELKRFVLVAPTFRGEELRLGERTFRSEGDPRNPFAGATEDLVALLSVALASVPQVDPARVGVFGHSRGGTVALLAGARDARIGCVVDWAGPTDWFRLMGENGFTPEELIRDALQHRATPREDGGQLVDQFLRPAIDRRAPLAEMREKLIASSPLSFAEDLPRTQLHYGSEDVSVPLANGTELAKRLATLHRPPRCDEVIVHAGAGHDQDSIDAPRQTRQFLLECLSRPAMECRR